MGTCDWLRIEIPEIVQSNGTELLKKVKVVMGKSVNPYDEKTPIRWGDFGDVYVFCSTRLPAVIFPDVQHNGKWVAQSLAPGYPEGTAHYLTDANIEYFEVCHNVAPPFPDDDSLGKKFGYPPGLVMHVMNTALSKPEDILTVGSISAVPSNLREIAGLSIKLTDFKWRKGGFNNVMIATFTIENDNPFTIKDIDVTCDIAAQSGTVLGHSAKTIYQIFPAKDRKIVRDFNMGVIDGQADRVSCKLGSWAEGQAE